MAKVAKKSELEIGSYARPFGLILVLWMLELTPVPTSCDIHDAPLKSSRLTMPPAWEHGIPCVGEQALVPVCFDVIPKIVG